MKQYLDLLNQVIKEGKLKEDRTGVGTRSIFGAQIRFDLNTNSTKGNFPLLTTKKLFLKGIIYELLWFLKGSTNISYLKEHGVNFWNPWADKDGNLGPVYGKQWRSWPSERGPLDQIANVIDNIKNNPDSRRLIVSAWNVGQIKDMALPPCHCLFQFYVLDNKLSLCLYQRSADIFLGVPFNIASYALLTMMIAQVCDLELGEFVHTFGDLHLYNNHYELAKIQLKRKPYALPKMTLNKEIKDIDKFEFTDFKLTNYQFHPHIKGAIAV